MRRSVLLLLLAPLSGCSVHSNSAANGADDVSIQADENGKVAFNLPFANGSVDLPRSMMRNGNIDIDGVKLMPGSSVTGFDMHGGDHGASVNIAFSAPQPPDQVRAYFTDQFRKQGVEVALAGDALTGKSKDGSAFTIEVTRAGSGSKGTIVTNDKE